jgi:hypothetical protein
LRQDPLESAERSGRAGDFKLCAASFKDHEQIASLESRFGLIAKNHDEWSHLWLGNPVYRELGRDWKIGWVLKDHDGRVVGAIANIPLMYEFEGRRILVASGRNWVVEPMYRSAALVLLDMVVNQKHVDLYLNNSIGKASAAAALDVFGCPRVPVGLWDDSRFWIARYRGFTESFLTWKNYPLAKPLSYPLAAAVFLRERFTKTGIRESDVRVTACSGFDERFDDFWETFKGRNPHLLLAVRTRELLEWHYKYGLLEDRVWIMTVVDGSRLLAYATFERRDKPEFRLKRLTLVDFQSLDGTTALLLPLLSRALKKCREEGIHALEAIGMWLENGDVIEKAAPYRRNLGVWTYVYRANDPELAESLKDRRAWAPSLFDGDASLCAGVISPPRPRVARLEVFVGSKP